MLLTGARDVVVVFFKGPPGRAFACHSEEGPVAIS